MLYEVITNTKFNEALKYYRQAYLLRSSHGGAESKATSALNLGNTYKDLSQSDSARFYYEQALKIYQQLELYEQTVV